MEDRGLTLKGEIIMMKAMKNFMRLARDGTFYVMKQQQIAIIRNCIQKI